MWMDEWDEGRNDGGRCQVDQDGVGGESGRVAAQLTRDHCRGGGGGADEAEHGSFDNDPDAGRQLFSCQGYGQRECGKGEGLHEQEPAVPAPELERVRVDFAECDEQHQEDEYRLNDGDAVQQERTHVAENRDGGTEKVARRAGKHGYGERPVL